MFKSTKQFVLPLIIGLFMTESLLADVVNDYQTRIVGGSQIQMHEAPSTVALLNINRLYQTGSYFQSQFCGGTVIDAQWVITAAHCLLTPAGVLTEAQDIAVLMGSSDLDNPINQPVGVSRVITHERYDNRTQANDIALLQLEYAALVPATPLDTQVTTINDVALIAGWGALEQADAAGQQRFPTQLQGAYVRMIPGVECGSLFQAYAGQVNDSNLCAGLPEGGVDSCQGDSGGPMYRFDSNNPDALRLAGIVSWGHGCADALAPGVYTRVAAYQGWINSYTNLSTQTVQPDSSVIESPVSLTSNVSSEQDGSNSLLAARDLSKGGASGMVMTFVLGVIGCVRLRTRRQSAAADAVKNASACADPSKSVASESLNTSQVKRKLDERSVTQLDWLRTYPVGLGSVVIAALFIALPPMGCAAHGASPQVLELRHLVMSKQRDAVLDDAQQLWEQSPACTVLRTGYGVGRRAYFLEQCGFSVQRENTICGAHPNWVDYRFLENELIQVSLAFSHITDENSYRECVQSLSMQKPVLAHQAIVVDDQLTTSISNTEALSHIHRIQ
jgi:secreted trypsin-like serine protease